jgi:DNA invertase Pin-like site-specific DNA recombinase
MLGRSKAPGSRNGSAVLLEDDVRRMRQQSADGIPNYRLAAEYGISPATVSRIINRKAWTHVE